MNKFGIESDCKTIQQEQVDEFNSLLDESKKWNVIKNFTQFNMEFRKKDDYEKGVPLLYMTCILTGVKPKDVFNLFHTQSESKLYVCDYMK